MTEPRRDVSEFLASRRAKVTPAQVGLPDYGGRRRVPGLRREEVALLAGVSPDYYVKLERGSLAGVSDSVLDAIARALLLDEAERTHLFDLARAAGSGKRPARGRASTVRPSVRRVLDSVASPAYVRNARMDVLAGNSPFFALYKSVVAPGGLPINMARFLFLDPRAPSFFLDWETVADDSAAALRIEAGRSPGDRQLSDLIGELATRSDAFATRWARHNVRLHRTATKRLNNPLVGELAVTGDALELPGEDLTMIVYTAEADSPAQEKLDFLARWTTDKSTDVRRGRETVDRPQA